MNGICLSLPEVPFVSTSDWVLRKIIKSSWYHGRVQNPDKSGAQICTICRVSNVTFLNANQRRVRRRRLRRRRRRTSRRRTRRKTRRTRIRTRRKTRRTRIRKKQEKREEEEEEGEEEELE